mmetsp:Transcript_53081/g.141919  ORF Transcript_53081/g.141919 Transcript_53081/m.141919 type:complete len:253 (+) Transcript_53081:653-1411(+)
MLSVEPVVDALQASTLLCELLISVHQLFLLDNIHLEGKLIINDWRHVHRFDHPVVNDLPVVSIQQWRVERITHFSVAQFDAQVLEDEVSVLLFGDLFCQLLPQFFLDTFQLGLRQFEGYTRLRVFSWQLSQPEGPLNQLIVRAPLHVDPRLDPFHRHEGDDAKEKGAYIEEDESASTLEVFRVPWIEESCFSPEQEGLPTESKSENPRNDPHHEEHVPRDLQKEHVVFLRPLILWRRCSAKQTRNNVMLLFP